MEIIRDIAEMQKNYEELLKSHHITKKALCDICVPFRDKYDLKDSTVLQIARNAMSLSELIDLFGLNDDRDVAKSPYPDGDKHILACPRCGSGEFLHNTDENENTYCGQCGQRILWEE